MADEKSPSLESNVSLEECAVEFVNSFVEDGVFDTPVKTIEDLSDAIVLFKILEHLDQEHFSMEEHSVKTDASKLLGKISNVRKLISALGKFFDTNSVFAKDTPTDLSFINVSGIGRNQDKGQLMKLVELVLLAAVNSEKKESAVRNIMGLPGAVQHTLMFIIQDTMERFGAGHLGDETESPSKARRSSVGSAGTAHSAANAAELEVLNQRIQELERDADGMKEQIHTLSAENKQLKISQHELQERIAEEQAARETAVEEAIKSTSKSFDDKRRQEESKNKRVVAQLQEQKHDLESEVSSLTSQLNGFTKKHNEEKENLAAQLRSLHDQLDVANEKARKLVATERTLERYKAKLDEMGAASARAQDAEAETQALLESNAELEEEAKKVPTLKARVQELMDKARESEAELEELKESHTAAKEDVKFLEEELKIKTSELETLREERAEWERSADLRSAASVVSLADESADVNARLAKLKAENKRLREAVKSSQGKVDADLKSKLDEAQEKLKKLTEKHRQVQEESRNQKRQIRDLTARSNRSVLTVKKLQEKLQAAEEKAQKPGGVDAEKYRKLQADFAEMRVKYKKLHDYARQARAKMKQGGTTPAGPPGGPGTSLAVNQLQQQLADVNAELAMVKKLRQESREFHKREQELMSSAFYNMGRELQLQLMMQQGAGKRGPAAHASPHRSSWLNRQRDRHS